MTVIDLKNDFKKIKMPKVPLLIALGNFDGVHIGHMALIQAMINQKKHFPGAKSAVYTFEKHPQFFAGTPKMIDLFDNSDKIARFAEAGVDYIIFEDFKAVCDLSPKDFAEEVLIGRCNCVCCFCGFNFHFGRKAAGSAETLCDLMKAKGLQCTVLPPVVHNGQIVSSSLIRSYVESGNMEAAAEILGRPFSIRFPVIYGNRIGHTIGIPTINQNFPEGAIIPKQGIYACTCFPEGQTEYLAVANIGTKPTVSNAGRINCETHILDYSGFLYGKQIQVRFHHRLRDEMSFSGLDELRAAIQKDISDTKAFFKNFH